MASSMLRRGLVRLALVANAHRPVRGPSPAERAAFVPSFFSSWVWIEYPVHVVVSQAVVTAIDIRRGRHEGWRGRLGLAATALSWIGMARLIRRAAQSGTEIAAALEAAGVEPSPEATPPPSNRLVTLAHFGRDGVDVERDVEFRDVDGVRLRLDVHRPGPGIGGGDRPRPAIVQLHGGAWMIGDKKEQAQPLLGHLASNGWVCVNANYRLSPRAEAPAHLVDAKAAVAWTREHADELGVDPDFICVTGGSAGGHLAALVGLTAGDTSLQPGFEEADTSVAAAVPIYGVFDFTDEAGANGREFVEFLERMVMRRSFAEHRSDFEAYSPMHRIHADAPPFMLVHGAADTLAPVSEGRRFRTALEAVSRERVVYLELPDAQHAFDVLWSPRTRHTVQAVERFLGQEWRRHIAGAARIASS